MGLPKLNTVEYFVTLPQSQIEVKYRPFNVKEQKVLLQALEEGDVKTIQHGLLSLIRACADTQDSSLKIEQLSNTDLEWLFIQIRMKSVGETTQLLLDCQDDTCDGQTQHEVDFNKMEMVGEMKDSKVLLNDTVGVILRVPTYQDVDNVAGQIKSDEELFSTNIIFELLNKCIVQIFDENTVHDATEFTAEEIGEFIESLTLDQFNVIMEWFESVPKMVYNAKYKCSKCGLEQSQELTGMQNFFV